MGTINFDQRKNPTDVLPDWTQVRGLKAVTFQLEQASRIHWQVFLEFEYPVGIKQIITDLESQGKQMHISDENTQRHPKAGRAYCSKGIAVDNHRYFWSKAHGWENNKCPVSKLETTTPNVRRIEFDGTNKEAIKNRLREIHLECIKYLKV